MIICAARGLNVLSQMKIIHIVDLSNYGGIQKLVTVLSRFQIDQQGLSISILNPFSNDDIQDIYRIKGAQFFTIGLKSGFDISPAKILTIIKIFSRNDIIHFHSFNPALYCAAILSGKRIIHTEHGTFQKLNQKINLLTYIKKRILGYLFLNHFADCVVFNSEWLRRNVNLRTSKQRTILNGIIIEEMQVVNKTNEEKEIFRVLGIGRIVIRKRFDRLIKGFSLIENKDQFYLDIVGDGPLCKDIKSLASKLLLENTYSFYGYRSDVASFYENADLLVLPTQYEPFGLVILEASLYGVPTICFHDGGGALEIVDNIHEKLIVKDEMELSENIQYWKDHPNELKRVGLLMRDRTINLFSVKRMAEEYLKIYQEDRSRQT